MAVVTIDSYSESNYRAFFALTLGGHGYYPTVGQSFTGNGGTLNSVELYLSKDSAITGSVYCYIYTHTGTYGTSSAPTTPLLAKSDALNVASIPNEPTLGLVSFTFSGEEQITLEDGVYYEIYFSVTGISNDGPTAYISVGADDSSPTHGGNAYYNYTTYSGVDLCFYVYGGETPTVTTTATSRLDRKCVIFGGNVTDQGSQAVTERGIYYGTDEFSQTNKLVSSSGLGEYSIFLSGLTPNTKYYYKAYATNAAGTSYGDVLSFTTGNSLSVGDKTALPPFNKA